MSRAYYNEIDPYCAQWLRNLIAVRHLPPGEVDERDIRTVAPGDLVGFGQCHFFAGIGGMPYGLRLAGLPDDFPIWTGGFPCQPFSSAARGRRLGREDDRYLWPQMCRLVQACRPRWALCENVAAFESMALDEVVSDMEAGGYEVAPPLEIPACSVGHDHWRPRYWILAYADGDGQPGSAVHVEMAELQGHRSDTGGMVSTHGISTRVAKLRAFGNAVVPQVVAEIGRAILTEARRAA
jgi:site-specific DNA-cytosine methylase